MSVGAFWFLGLHSERTGFPADGRVGPMRSAERVPGCRTLSLLQENLRLGGLEEEVGT